MRAMRGFVAPTDHGWYQFLLARPELDVVNFWRPGATPFAALSPGEPFVFKLKAPYDVIGGFGLFAGFSRLPVWRAWDVFGPANGTADEWLLLARVQQLGRADAPARSLDRVIGCIAVTQVVFFAPDEWVAVPEDWSRNIVSGRAYDLESGPGRRLWDECLQRAAAGRGWVAEALHRRRTGAPQLVVPRLGQASFRLAVLDAYGRQCAVTTEHSLPVLEAAHIRPWAAGGAHALPNGLPLRRDLHRLFDLGYVTVRPDLRFAVSRRLRDEFANGRAYYDLDGRAIQLPASPAARPDRELLSWHEAEVFRR
jgi:putative restriction endonuclease